MALEWVNRVDGIDVFPKLAVYLRTYFKQCAAATPPPPASRHRH